MIARIALMIAALGGVGMTSAPLRQDGQVQQAAVPGSIHNGDIPPARFQQDNHADVHFLNDPETRCGMAPRPYVRFGCVFDKRTAILPNPCAFPGERFARYACHEMGHVNGWPRNHGD